MKRYIAKTMLYILILLSIISIVGYCLPFNPNSFTREQLVKNEMLKRQDRLPSVILVGGSSVVYGFQSPLLQDSLAQHVINNGMQAGLGLKMSIDNCARYLIPGDTLIIIPEYSHFFEKSAWGGLYLADLFYLNPKDFIPLLNLYQFKSIINNTPQHIQSKISYVLSHFAHSSEKSDYALSSFNEYGDKVAHYGLPNKDFYYDLPIKRNTDAFNRKYFAILLGQIKVIEQKGVKVFFFPPPMAESFYQSEKVNVDYVEKELRINGRCFICNPIICVYPDSLFYDSYYHLNEQGSAQNSQQLVKFLK